MAKAENANRKNIVVKSECCRMFLKFDKDRRVDAESTESFLKVVILESEMDSALCWEFFHVH